MASMLRAAVVGTGWGLVHVHALRQQGAEVVALAGRDGATVGRIAAEQQVPLAVTDLGTLHTLALDLVCIATPPHTHAEVAACLRPLPMLCEKPLLGPEGQAQQRSAFSPRCWVNYAFPYLAEAQQAARLLPQLGEVRRVEVETTHDFGRAYTPAAALAELASHPWWFVMHRFGPPAAAQGFVDEAGGVSLTMRLGRTPTQVRCRGAPGLGGLRHRVCIHTERGALEIDGRFRHGGAWHFQPLRLAGEALPGAVFSPAEAGGPGDPWIAANVAAIGDVLAILRGELSESAALARGLCNVAQAFTIDDTIHHAPLQGLTLRPGTTADLDLTYAISREAMRGYVEATWGRWDETEQRAKHQQSFDHRTLRIVQLAGEAAGLVVVEDEAHHHWLVKLYLLEHARCRGLGSHLLEREIVRAEAARKPLRLRVLRVNTRARALYERHGFGVIEETPERLFMERPAAAP